MKLYRNMIILGIIMLTLAGAYFIVKSFVPEEDKDIYKLVQITDLDQTKVVDLIIKNSEGEFVFKKDEDQWKMVSGGDFVYDTFKLDSITTNVCNIEIFKKVEESPENPEQYGFDRPIMITAKTSDGEIASIEVGNITPTEEGYYIRSMDDNTIYTIAVYAGKILSPTKTDLRNKFILDVTSADVTELALTREGKKIFSVAKQEEIGWGMSEPIESGVDMIRLNTALQSLVRAEITDYIEEEDTKDLSEYGLDTPSYILEAAAGEQRVKLLLGNIKENYKAPYGMRDGTNEVFTINPQLINFLDITTVEVMDGFIYAPYIFDVAAIEIRMDGNTVNLKIEAGKTEGEEDGRFYVDDNDVTAKGEEAISRFKDYYQSLISVLAMDIEQNANVSGEPQISITYRLSKGSEVVKVEFIPKNENTYYAMKDGRYTGIVVSRDEFYGDEGVKSAYNKLMQYF